MTKKTSKAQKTLKDLSVRNPCFYLCLWKNPEKEGGSDWQ